jgi:hypothetical protein
MTCSIGSSDLTPDMQILSILWLQDMYHQGRTKENSFTKVVTTYGMNRTSSESAQIDFSEGVYRLKKESRLLKYATHHHMEVIMGAFHTHAKI